MKHLASSLILFVSCLVSTQVYAVKILECVDEAGNKTFQDRCPPGTTQAGEKKFYTGKEPTASENKSVAVTFYSIPECDACDLVRNLLDKYGASITEKNVKTDVGLQKELQEKTGAQGTLSVPTVIIGDQVIIGYKKQDIINSLETTGLEDQQPGEEAETAEATDESEQETDTAEQTDEEAQPDTEEQS